MHSDSVCQKLLTYPEHINSHLCFIWSKRSKIGGFCASKMSGEPYGGSYRKRPGPNMLPTSLGGLFHCARMTNISVNGCSNSDSRPVVFDCVSPRTACDALRLAVGSFTAHELNWSFKHMLSSGAFQKNNAAKCPQ